MAMESPEGVPDSQKAEDQTTQMFVLKIISVEEMEDVLSFFNEEGDKAPIEIQVRLKLQEIRDTGPDDTKLTREQIREQKSCRESFRGMVAELRRATQEEAIQWILDAIELLVKQMPDFEEFAPLLRRYADHRRKHPDFMNIPDKIDSGAAEYADFSRQNPDDLEGRRERLNSVHAQFVFAGNHVTFMEEVGSDAGRFLAQEERELRKLEKEAEKKARATARLRRDLSEEGREVKRRIDKLMAQDIDTMKRHRELKELVEDEKNFKGYKDKGTDEIFLVRYADAKLEDLLEENIGDLNRYFRNGVKYLSEESDEKAFRKQLQRYKRDLKAVGDNNHLFRNPFGQRWKNKLESLTPAPKKGISCIRAAIYSVLIAGVAAGVSFATATFDKWGPRFGFSFPSVKAPKTPGNGIAAPSSKTPIAPLSVEEKKRRAIAKLKAGIQSAEAKIYENIRALHSSDEADMIIKRVRAWIELYHRDPQGAFAEAAFKLDSSGSITSDHVTGDNLSEKWLGTYISRDVKLKKLKGGE